MMWLVILGIFLFTALTIFVLTRSASDRSRLEEKLTGTEPKEMEETIFKIVFAAAMMIALALANTFKSGF